MYYFISENVFEFNSGTEHGQAQRTRLFNAQGKKAYYVSRNYNRFLHRDLLSEGLTPAMSLNMYDYFQGALKTPRVEQNIRLLPEIPLDEYHIESINANYSMVRHAGRDVGQLNVLPGTIGLTMTVESRDLRRNIVTRENWDWRGFKSSADYFHPDGSVASRLYFNVDGQPVLEEVWMNRGDQVAPTMWKLLNYKGRDHRFDNENDLFEFFLTELLKPDQDAIVIADRHTLDDVVANIPGVKAKWGYLHGVHTNNARTPVNGQLLLVYQTLLERRPADFTGVLVATQEQKDDILLHYPLAKVRVAPDAAISEVYGHQAKAKQPKIIFVGRFGTDKRPNHALVVMSNVVKKVPTAQLELYGYAPSQQAQDKLTEQIKELDLEDNVTIKNYLHHEQLVEAYGDADVILQTSTVESFGMNLVEAMSYGVPVVSYDIKYGTKVLVQDDVNGYVVPDKGIKQMAEKVVQLLTDDADWQAKSAAALTKATEFTFDRVISKWATALQ
ncbi:glycosyltransferase [Loigolactobacillus coryniformis]|jgi:poly(glycerol-phosphate) alpha-glucosyltransferase|uniref:Lipopolysaccharide biosynthesis protein n=1 Tax=Loigolactobacillus coryniformis subsp. coryniformis CECT 5711 TaxID=1185325 RepID=J3JBD4_9LACO|nr:glycosyltransferase [Loigolactobacillus coryniformis]EJN55624.1 Lipopolysaccharide biosynthesis protein [Loigolactobacillus coryniformis subsp. coryniformis CECT 5711]